MKAVIYGAGNIGRGFIGALFSQSGYEVAFIDIDERIVTRLNDERQYCVREVSNDGYKDNIIKPVCAIDGRNIEAVADAVARADLIATAVGVRALPHIAPSLAKGLTLRLTEHQKPVNIIICENLLNANSALRNEISKHLPSTDINLILANVGFVEAAIGRMVPIQTPEMQSGDPLRVCVESYGYLPVDLDGFVGALPDIRGMIPYSPFDFYIKRKLYIHNLGHACCAYLGMYNKLEYIYEAIGDPDIRSICQGAMLESAAALAAQYNESAAALTDHVSDLIERFGNRALMDTCARVGNDIPRKLAPADRLIGAAHCCLAQNVMPTHIATGCAAAVYAYINQNNMEQTLKNAQAVLSDHAGLAPEHPLARYILPIYAMLAEGLSIAKVREFIQNACSIGIIGV